MQFVHGRGSSINPEELYNKYFDVKIFYHLTQQIELYLKDNYQTMCKHFF